MISGFAAEAVAMFDVGDFPAILFLDDFDDEVAIFGGDFSDGIGVIHLHFGTACHIGGVFGDDLTGEVLSPWFGQLFKGVSEFAGDRVEDIFAAAFFPRAEEFAESEQEVHQFDGGLGGACAFFLLSEHDVIDDPASFGGVFDEDELVFDGAIFFFGNGFAASLFID
ncbi:MAG TPA: hypothetical protein DIT89_01925 [Planctomycetaceae bacterium]|nr:hypothetical protein [Planctomycetaceae bacterium]